MEKFNGVTVFLDTSPLIYLVEVKEPYYSIMVAISSKLKSREIQAVTSPITLAECLIYPIKMKDLELIRKFRTVILRGGGIKFYGINSKVGELSAQLRNKYNLQLPDALQIALAIQSECAIFLTNDTQLKRVTEISVVCLDDLLATV